MRYSQIRPSSQVATLSSALFIAAFLFATMTQAKTTSRLNILDAEAECIELTVLMCPAGAITLSTQAGVDAFSTTYPGCTSLLNHLTISGSNITNLNGLNVITSINGYLNINNNPNLISLSGLSNLNSIAGNLDIVSCNALTNLNGLSNLNSIGNGLNIGSNTALTSLSGFGDPTIAQDITINDNDALTSLSALSYLTSTNGELNIMSNGALINLAGLENIITVTEQLLINDNDALTSLSALSNLTSIGTHLSIYENDVLTSLNGFNNLTSITGLLNISYNATLVNLNGLNHPISISGSLTIQNNSILSDCAAEAICDYLDMPAGTITIQSNATGCNSETDVETACLAPQCPTNITFSSQAEIDAFPSMYPGCTSITGDVSILNGTDISNLNGLSALVTIGGFLVIHFNTSLSSLDGLNNLTSIGTSLTITANPALTSLDGLNNLASIGTYLDIQNNPNLSSLNALTNLTSLSSVVNIHGTALTNLNGLHNLTSFGTYLAISDNPALTSLSALNNLTSIDELHIVDNDALTNLSGMDNLTSIGGPLILWNNGVLTSLNALNNLAFIGDLAIGFNDALTNLSGLNHPISISGDLTIQNNSILSDCAAEAICDYLDLAIPPGIITIQMNQTGCNNQTEVKAACLSLPVELVRFEGKIHESKVLLSWLTASELNNAGFYIERSADGQTYQTIGFVAGHGTRTEEQSYSFLDDKAFSGINYYRLRQLDFDGREEYSHIVSLAIQLASSTLQIFPNPVSHGLVNIHLPVNEEEATLSLFNLDGKLLEKTAMFIQETTLETQELAVGIYLLEVKTAHETWQQKLVVKQ